MSRVTQRQKSIWFDHIRKQPTSKLTQRAYCHQHDLNLRQFGYWKRVLQLEADASSKPKRTQSGQFVPAQLAPPMVSQALTITLPNGVLISGIDDGNQHLISTLLGACR